MYAESLKARIRNVMSSRNLPVRAAVLNERRGFWVSFSDADFQSIVTIPASSAETVIANIPDPCTVDQLWSLLAEADRHAWAAPENIRPPQSVPDNEPRENGIPRSLIDE